ncbi:hypothetical protein HBH98_063970 [Parastagonospora nodorum]|nr:hypothetical protein HBH51_043950 [Parastagonospora nodorum]KAH4069785.1 hypothetical protein HBH50_104300 [Parastagonospora nodorum]KAH4090193.1 hypothetical protein HBH48_108070 [Parastagonospora nodorum]KAH4125339.1 hypothetical protein HBH47_061290 [Parastagonospora nodorum]KAH4202172.1 hypothetical protein HBH42_014730 [Parastagonospora nodorum]
MQLTLLSVAAAMAATVSAYDLFPEKGKTAVELNRDFDPSSRHARIINRCDYDVHIWSVYKNIGCEDSEMVTLKKGESYGENYQTPGASGVGVSIKVSKTTQCTGSNIVQLEYFLETRMDPQYKDYHANFLDVSYVDCLGGDCPTKKEGYYLAAGSQTARAKKVTADNSWCPILACHDAASCAKMSYILPNDVQTKTCGLEDSMEFYMCGSQPPSEDDEKPAYSAPAPSSKQPETPSKQPETPTPKPTPTEAPSSSADGYKIDIPAVTPPAQLKDEPKEPKIKTKTVVVTAYEYVNAKRSEHVHRHARRHQPFHA